MSPSLMGCLRPGLESGSVRSDRFAEPNRPESGHAVPDRWPRVRSLRREPCVDLAEGRGHRPLILIVPEFAATARYLEPVVPGDADRRRALLWVPAEGLKSPGRRAAPASGPANRSGMWSRHQGLRRNH
jgi:hypothetical protein